MTTESGGTRLHCVLDARPALRRSTGVGTYVEGLLEGFAALEERPSMTVFTASWKDRPRPRLLELTRRMAGVQVHRRLPVGWLNWSWHALRWPPVEALLHGSLPGGVEHLICHSPHPLVLPTRRGRKVVTVHDLYFLQRPEETFAEVQRDYPRLLERSLRDADAVICVSEHTRTDLLERFGDGLGPSLKDKISVVYNGIDLDFFTPGPSPPVTTTRTIDPNLPRPYLAVGRIEARKNPIRLLEAFAAASTEAPLVWAGTPADASWQHEVERCIDRLGLEDRVRVLGYVERDDLRDLYRAAGALLYPSLHEGFGLPILEAMACGCPVLTGDRTAMPEVAGGAAVLVDPTRVDSIRAGIEEIESAGRRADLRSAGLARVRDFSWATCAQRTLDVYRLA